jgi:hypothetical protein
MLVIEDGTQAPGVGSLSKKCKTSIRKRGIGVFTSTLKANCDFSPTFRNFVILPLFYENESLLCPLLLTVLVGSQINKFKKKEKSFIVVWKDNNTPYPVYPPPNSLPDPDPPLSPRVSSFILIQPGDGCARQKQLRRQQL